MCPGQCQCPDWPGLGDMLTAGAGGRSSLSQTIWTWRWERVKSPHENQGAISKKGGMIAGETKATVSHSGCQPCPTLPTPSMVSQILCRSPRETAKALQCHIISMPTDRKATLTKRQKVMNSRRVMV